MNVLVTRTKVLLPRRPATLLTRERLLDLLCDLLDCRLIIIAAPAGYGKTSVLIDLAHYVKLPVCWYALDPLDQDPHRFLAHFIVSIAERFPNFGKQSSAALQSAISPDLDTDQLVSIITNEVYEQVQEHFVLVLDDYHMIGDNRFINRFISRFVEAVDENCHLIISSRTLLTLPDLPLMVARSQVGGLEFKDLAFRADEIQTLMLQNYHLTMPTSEAERLAQETEGWITGLLLSAQTMWQGMADQVRLARVSGVGLYDYLAQQVLDQQSASVREFLLRTSLLDEFDAELCRAVLGPDENWGHLIDVVLRSNLFVLPVDNGDTWLRYHHLFRDFLQTRLAQKHPEEREHILRRLAAVYAERAEWEKAYDIYRRLADMTATADLIEQAGPSLVKNGRWTTLAGWLDALPAEILASHPGLLSLRGFTAVELGEAEQGLALLNQAETIFRETSDMPRLARTLVRRAVDRRLLGEYLASLADADEALALSQHDRDMLAIQAEALRAKGGSLYQLGQLNEAIEWLARSLQVYTALNDEQNVAMLLMELGLTYMSTGRYDQALTHYDRALSFWRRTGDLFRKANLLNNLGVLRYLQGDYEQARLFLEEAIDCARRSGYARIEALALSSLGDLYADLDAFDAASNAYRQADKIVQQTGERFLLLYLNLAEAALSRLSGNKAQARALLKVAQPLAQNSGSGFEQGLWQWEAGRLALAEGDALQAITHLDEAVRHFDKGGQRVEAACTVLSLAVAHWTSENKEAAMTHLGCAFRIAANLESQHTLVVAGREAQKLLVAAPNTGIIGHQAFRLLRQIVQFEQQMPALRRRLRRQASTIPLTPPKLYFQAFGSVRVVVNERSVTNAEWQAQVARDLLFCLLAHPNGLTKEAVGAIFWPESTPAQLKLQFKQTVYRLRRVLGQDVVLLDQDRYRANRALDYEYDVEAFLGKLAQAQAATAWAERAAAYRAALDLYTGPYLLMMDGTWVYPERERLQQVFVEAALAVAEFYLETGEYGAAVEYCQRVLAQDSCQEEAHRLVMRAYAALGNQAAVTRQFERCRQALLQEVNAPLAPQTEELYKRLTHH